MKRILIIGSNGAGKTTFSYKLSEKLNLPLVHIDSLYWRDNWQVTPQDEFESVAPKEEPEQTQEELDLQKELEAKFDELFGPIDDE